MSKREEIKKLRARAEKCGFFLSESEARNILDIFKNTPATREEKIKRLKKEIESGQYHPDSRAIANGILKNVVEEEIIPRRLQKIPPGREFWSLYQKLCSYYIVKVFKNELSTPISEAGKLKRYDLILYNKAKNGFWYDMKKSHDITHVIFEIKNWTKNDHKKFSEQVSRYYEAHRAIILVTRSEPDYKLYHEFSSIFKKHDKFVLLPISDTKLEEAEQLKRIGVSPSEIFEEPYLYLQAA